MGELRIFFCDRLAQRIANRTGRAIEEIDPRLRRNDMGVILDDAGARQGIEANGTDTGNAIQRLLEITRCPKQGLQR